MSVVAVLARHALGTRWVVHIFDVFLSWSELVSSLHHIENGHFQFTSKTLTRDVAFHLYVLGREHVSVGNF